MIYFCVFLLGGSGTSHIANEVNLLGDFKDDKLLQQSKIYDKNFVILLSGK